MLRSICYKEWIKIRKIVFLLTIVALVAIAGIYLTVRHDLVLKDAEKVWDSIINQKNIYFSIFKFLPLIMGLLIGIAQFVPETIDKRVKLSLHLPMNEEEVILKMVGFGTVVVVGIFALLLFVFSVWGLVYFPYEIVRMSVLTMLPWFVSALAAYFFASFVILEPNWKYRVYYLLAGGAFISLFYLSNIAGSYQPALWPLTGCMLLASISSLFSIYRFRKGEM